MKSKKFHRIQIVRRWIQVISFAGIISIPILNHFEITYVLGTLYSLSLGPLEIIDPAMAIQTVILSKQIYLPMIFALILPVGSALAMGRVFCSWACPYNTLLEWIDTLQRRLLPVKWRQSHARGTHCNPNRKWYWGILATITVMTLVLNFPLFTHLSFPGIISKGISNMILLGEVNIILILVCVVLLVEILMFRRFWCTYICPVGACIGAFKNPKSLEIKYNPDTCICKSNAIKPCHTACPLHLAPTEKNVYPYCFNCGLCVQACGQTHNNNGLRNFGWGADSFEQGR